MLKKGKDLGLKASRLIQITFTLWLISNLFIFLYPISLSKSIPKNYDKIYHFCFSFLTAYLYYLSFIKRELVLIESFFFTLIYGFIIEILQSFLPYRDFSILDLICDGIGAFIFLTIILILKRIRASLSIF
jgi:VanZ family protein